MQMQAENLPLLAHYQGGMMRVNSTRPIKIRCPNCQNDDFTHSATSASGMAWASCAVMCIFGCWCCCCIPFCMEDCKEADHRCKNCNSLVAQKKARRL
mmetsp:Transcript_25278/g.24676  ORF Transcript_25278/g.24676 Transcript_25278/m.24676 type:complete len:98 (+) Transcript_25278:353-646(+)